MRPSTVVLLMGFFGSLFGCSKGSGDSPERHVTEAAFRKNLSSQTTMSPQTLAQLRKHGVTDTTELKLEFFFYTNNESKGQRLARALQALDTKLNASLRAGILVCFSSQVGRLRFK